MVVFSELIMDYSRFQLFQVFGAEDGKGKTTYKGFYEFTGNLEEHTTLFHDFADCFEKTSLPSVLVSLVIWVISIHSFR